MYCKRQNFVTENVHYLYCFRSTAKIKDYNWVTKLQKCVCYIEQIFHCIKIAPDESDENPSFLTWLKKI